MMLTQQSLVHKCLFKSKMEVYILYKRVWSDQETGSRNEGGGATSSEAAREYFGASWRLVIVTKNDLRILKYLAWYSRKKLHNIGCWVDEKLLNFFRLASHKVKIATLMIEIPSR